MTKVDRLHSMIRGRMTPARCVTEIIKGGWEKTRWSGESVTTKTERRGMVRFARNVRRLGLDGYRGPGLHLWRVFTGGEIKPLNLP